MKLTESELELLLSFDSPAPVPCSFEAAQCLTRHGLLEVAYTSGGVYFWRLSRSGRLLVEAHAKENAERAEKAAKEKLAEAKRLEERREDKADEERRYRTQNKIAIIMPFVTFFLGLVAEYFLGILSFIISFFH